MAVTTLTLDPTLHPKNNFKTKYSRCDSVVQFMEYNSIYRCLKKTGHSGLHKAINKNQFGVKQGLWNDERIILNLMSPDARIGKWRCDV